MDEEEPHTSDESNMPENAGWWCCCVLGAAVEAAFEGMPQSCGGEAKDCAAGGLVRAAAGAGESNVRPAKASLML